MFSVPFFVITKFFKGIFSFIFSDWRILVAILLAIALAIGYFKWQHLESQLEAKQQEVVKMKQDNEILKANNETLTQANQQNQQVIEQIRKDQEQALAALSKLNQDIAKSNKKVSDLHVKLEQIKTPPTPLSPYLVEAIDGVQKMRGETPAVPAPVRSASAPAKTIPPSKAKPKTTAERRSFIQRLKKVQK